MPLLDCCRWQRRSPCGSADRNDANLHEGTVAKVAPRAGARIETCSRTRCRARLGVAPRAGARIETALSPAASAGTGVAPRAGARIETTPVQDALTRALSLPVRERGSKHSLAGVEVD